MTKPATRLTQLDGIRAVAISSVFIHHAFNIPLLWLGVDIFFVLSGFLITGILVDRKAQGKSYFSYFYARRARRILPPYALLLVFVSTVSGLAWVAHWYWFIFLANVGAVLGQLGLSDELNPLWSLALEEQFYLIWPVAVLLLSRRGLYRFSIGLLAVVPLLRFFASPYMPNHFYVYFLLPFRMDLLAAGALCALVWRDQRSWFAKWAPIARWLPALSLALLALLSHFPIFRTNKNTSLGNMVIYEITLLLAASMLIWALGSTGRFKRLLDHPAARTLGILSYTFYLVHATMLMLVHRWHLGILTGALVAFTLSITYALISWYVMERRLIHGPPLPLFEREAA
jgi:peptidoglycan/LPS O-acetylase OafA/YrhL